MTTISLYCILSPMGQWEPPEDWEKVGLLMRKDFHRKIRIMAAESGKKPWQILDRLLSPLLKGKKIPKFEDLSD